ncbi:MAG: pyridoxal phosphate-dependent aminotransferase, partial [Candidatus Aminicenantes bacterium]|nr:pyridoxal phosphate-dependent aminotransferase [Candidatus Aminicenantes bacterium]
DCLNAECQRIDDCRLDRGSPFCYKASKHAHTLLDPYWINGPAKHIKRTALNWVFILRSDATSPPLVKMDPEDALRIMESGESLGSRGTLGPLKNNPFFNSHLLHTSSDRLDHHKTFFRHLSANIPCYLFNSGVGKVEDILNVVVGESGKNKSQE